MKSLRSYLLCATAMAALAVSARATVPTVEHSSSGTDYSLSWGEAAQITDATFSLKINGEWIYGDAFPKRVWSSEKGRLVLRCSGLPPVEEFVLTIETAESRPYAVVSATVKASAEFKLGGVRVLTKKGDAENLSVSAPANQWTVFIEALQAPDYGRIYKLAQLV